MINIENTQRPLAFCRALGKSFTVSNKRGTVEIGLFDEIGPFGVTAAQFRDELNQVREAGHILLKINSPGGDVFDGIAIHNELKQHHADVTVQVVGIAASAASVVAMAGDRIEMAGNAFMMIHRAWALAIGNEATMRAMADTLENIDGALVDTYQQRTGQKAADIADWMAAETWLNAEDAKASGFSDATIGEQTPSALFDLSIFSAVPMPLKRQVEAGLRRAGHSRGAAAAAVNRGFQAVFSEQGTVSMADAERIMAVIAEGKTALQRPAW